MPRLPLVLFDIDGTLLRAGEPVHARSVAVACKEVFGVDAELGQVSHAGRTDRWILQSLLALYGIPPEESEPRLPEAFAAMEAYVAAQLPPSLAERVLPGVPETLAALAERDLALGLVTGNLRGIAEAKLSKAGIWGPFAAEGGGIGGHGDVSSERADLVRAALVMAEQSLGRPVPAASAVIIGDTPHDIDCGRACAARTVGVATGRFTAAQLRDAGADFVLDDLTDQAPLLRFFLDGRATGG